MYSNMKTILFALASLPIASGFKVNVCFTLANKGVEGAEVQCYDEDSWGSDAIVGPASPAYTDSNGCVSITDNQSWWEMPDIYCYIVANGDCFASVTTSTMNDHQTDGDVNFGTIALGYDHDYCGDFGAGGNGCGGASFPSWLNDAFTSVSGFGTQCAAHDSCYGDCSKTRSKCDDDFLDDMDAACAGSWTCSLLADIFYEAVDSYGGERFCKAGRDKGLCEDAGYNKCSQ
jgi:hypothetical protein